MHARDLRPRGAGLLLKHFVGLYLIASATKRSSIGYANTYEGTKAGEGGNYCRQGDRDFIWHSLQSLRSLPVGEETYSIGIREDVSVASIGYPPVCEFNVTLNVNRLRAGETKVFGTLQNASNIDLTTCESLLICFEDVDSSTQDASSTIHCVSEGELLNSSFIVEERTFFLQPHHRYYGEVCRLLSCFIRQLFARRIAQNRQPLWVEQTTPQLGSEDMNQLVKNAPWYKRVFSMFSSSFPLVVAAEATPIPIPMDDQSPEPPILTSPLPVLAYSNVVYSTELREANCELCVFMLGQKDSCDADESSATGYLQILVKEADPGNSANSIKPKILQLRGYNVSDICDMSMTFAIYASTSGGQLGFQYVNVTEPDAFTNLDYAQSCGSEKCGNIGLYSGAIMKYSDQLYVTIDDQNHITVRLKLSEKGQNCTGLNKTENNILVIAEFLFSHTKIDNGAVTIHPSMVNLKHVNDSAGQPMAVWAINSNSTSIPKYCEGCSKIICCKGADESDCSGQCIPKYPNYEDLIVEGTCNDGDNSLLNLTCTNFEPDQNSVNINECFPKPPATDPPGPPTDEEKSKNNNTSSLLKTKDLLMILICLVGVVIVAFLVRLGVHIPSLWRRKDGTTDLEAQNSSISDTMELRSSRRSEGEHVWEIDYDDIEFNYEIGRGGSGSIWHCSWRNATVAVKCLTTPFPVASNNREEDSRTIEREIEILSGLRHPNIVTYLGACRPPPSWCLVMEYCRRGSLENVLYNQPEVKMGIIRKLRFLIHIVRGMTYLHSQTPCIIHRDLKPANLLVADDFTVKVCDLGLSYRITRSHVTRATTVGGTAAYVSPEHLRNEPFSEKMDIWSFGVTMLEIITRTRPHGELRDYAQVVARVLYEPIPAFPAPTNETELALKNLYEQCCSFVPKDRPSFADIHTILDRMLTQEFQRTRG